jgi:protoporphyrinogen oxidase
MKQLTVVGAGWSGLAAAVAATQAGWHVQLFEASNTAGGRARSLQQSFAGHPLDNGQHALIGAYHDTLTLMRTVGLDPDRLLRRIPLDLSFADGQGLTLPNWGWKDPTLNSVFSELHELAGLLLALCLVLHVGGALVHQFILRDELNRRMGFGSRTGE